MGCIEPSQPQIHDKHQISDCRMTNKEYLKYLITQIMQQQSLTLLLDKNAFESMLNSLNQNYHPPEMEILLIDLLEKYVKLSVYCVQDQIQIQNGNLYQLIGKYGDCFIKYNDLSNFGSIFANQMAKIQNQVKMMKEWTIQSIDYSSNFITKKFTIISQQELELTLKQVKSLSQKQSLAIAYLSSYLVLSCQNLQKQGKQITQINKILKQLCNGLKNQFSVKSKRQQERGTNSDNQALKQKIKNYKSEDKLKQIEFHSTDKQKELEDEIMKLVTIAKDNISFFNYLMFANCINNSGFNYKSNLKLTSRSNKSALHRVKQKILGSFIEQMVVPCMKNQRLINCKSIKQWVQQQNEYIAQLIKQCLKNIDRLTLNITDILRGKCMFNKVQQIVAAAEAITKQIELQKSKGRNIQLFEVTNRLSIITQDLMFKIKIDDLVCQFQFVLFFNKTENQIHHKMYEIVRSKSLSSLSILYDWYAKSIQAFFIFINNFLQYPLKDEQQKLNMHNKVQNLQKFLQIEQITTTPPVALNLASNIIGLLNTKKSTKKMLSLAPLTNYRTSNYFIGLNKISHFDQLKNNLQQQNKQTDRNQEVQRKLQILGFYNQGKIYLDKGLYQQALQQFLKGYQLQKKLKDHQKYEAFSFLGAVYLKLGNQKQAIFYCAKDTEQNQRLYGSNSSKFATSLINYAAVLAFNDGQKSLQCYQQCKRIKQILLEVQDLEYALVLSNIATILSRKQEYVEALDNLRKAEAINEKMLGKNCVENSKIISKIAQIFHGQGHHQKAIEQFQKCLVIQITIHGKMHNDYIQALFLLARCYNCQQKNQQSLKAYKQVLQLQEALWKGKTQGSFQALNNAATVCFQMGRKDECIDFLKQQIELVEKFQLEALKVDKNYPIYDNICKILRKSGKTEEAIKMSISFLKKIQLSKGKVSTVYVKWLQSLALCYVQVNKYQQAQLIYVQILDLQNKLYGSPINSSQTLNNLAAVSMKQDKKSQAVKYLQKQAQLLEKQIQNDQKKIDQYYQKLFSIYDNIGKILQKLGRYADAIIIKNKKLALIQNRMGKMNQTYIQNLKYLGDSYNSLKQYNQSLKIYHKMLSLQEELDKGRTLKCQSILNNIGAVHFFMGQFQDAVKYHQQSLLLIQKHVGKNTAKYEQKMYSAGLIYRNLKIYDKALNYLQQCLEIVDKLQGKESPRYKLITQKINNIISLRQQNQKRENQQKLVF